jgi:uncharacterized membrane-anchored protein
MLVIRNGGGLLLKIRKRDILHREVVSIMKSQGAGGGTFPNVGSANDFLVFLAHQHMLQQNSH